MSTLNFLKINKNQDQIQRHITNFEETSQVPQVVGVDYFNLKHAYSVNLLGVGDINMLFLCASVGYPGSIHVYCSCQTFIRK